MKTQIVLGTFFGDEGKGSTVQWLCKEAIDRGEKPIVIRFSGGQQAGHRIICNGIEHVCSLFGSGVLLGVPTYLDRNVIVDPICMYEEYQQLVEKGVTPIVYIHPQCRVTTPYDVNANVKDERVLGHGSCGMGIFHTFKRCEDDDKKDPFERLYNVNILDAFHDPKNYLNQVRAYYGCETMNDWEEKFIACCQWLRDFATIKLDYDFDECTIFIFEGSQGLLLDMECGFMPNCTPTKVGLNGVPEIYLKDAEVFMVMRIYLTRHGNGYNPFREDVVREHFYLDEPTNPNDGFQGVFKYGVFEENLLRRVIDRHHIDNLKLQHQFKLYGVITHLDCAKTTDCIPFLDRNQDYTRVKIGRFLSFQSLYFDKLYGSYSPELSNEQFKIIIKQ